MHYRYTQLFTALLSLFVFVATAQPCVEQDTTEQFAGLCSGESLVYNGQTISAPGDYEFVFTGTDGCDSLVLLFVVDFHFSVTKQSICAGDSMMWGGEWLSTEGFYTDTVLNGGQCDSLAFLELMVLAPTFTELNAYICLGDSVQYNGVWYFAGDSVTLKFTDAHGCDSTVRYIVYSYPIVPTTYIDSSICEGDSVFFGGNWINFSGTFSFISSNQNGCYSLTELALTVYPYNSAQYTASICPGDSFLWYGTYYFNPGQYNIVLPNAEDCDSLLTLQLQTYQTYLFQDTVSICSGGFVIFDGQPISTPGFYSHTYASINGCDSIHTLQLLVKPAYTSSFADTICQGNLYNFGNNTYTTSGSYQHTFIAANDCDSVVTLQLTVAQPITVQQQATICSGQQYNFNDSLLGNAGTYTQTLTTVNGCDSVLILELTVIQPVTIAQQATICSGQQYNFNGNMLSNAGTYSQTLTAANGCDSVVTLQLTVAQPITVQQQATICSGQQYNFNGSLLGNAGTYTQNLTTANGCDSVLILELTVIQPVIIAQQATICSGQQYNFYGNALTATGNYSHTIGQGTGCDTTITLQLTVTDTLFTNISASVCNGQSYNFYGNQLTATGTYQQFFTTAQGCDSIVVLQLTQNSTFSIATQQTICQGQSINFFGNIVSTTGTYTHNGTTANGCDSIVVLQLTVKDTFKTVINQTACYDGFYNFYGQQLSTTGVYYTTLQSSGGCDSLIELHLTIDTQIVTHIYATICSNTAYDFFGTTYNTPGIYGFALVSSAGCDSIVRLHLSVNQPSTATNLTAQICSGSSYVFAGNTLTQPGGYSYTYQNAVGCDSVVNLVLTVNDSVVTNQQAFICLGDTLDFYGTPIWYSGIFKKYLTTTAGCDSIIQLNIGVLATPLTSVSQSICKGSSYNFFGSTLTQAGVYQHKIPTGGQCDSVVELTLTVKDTFATLTSASICANNNYNFYGTILNTEGTYTHVLTGSNGCDSTIYFTLSVAPVYQYSTDTSILIGGTYTLPGGSVVSAAGTYMDTLNSIAGCDSIVITNLSVIIGVNSVFAGYAWSVYPNPANEQLKVLINTSESSYAAIVLTDLSGRVVQPVFEGVLTAGKSEWVLSVSQIAAGTYLLRINEQTVRVAVVH